MRCTHFPRHVGPCAKVQFCLLHPPGLLALWQGILPSGSGLQQQNVEHKESVIGCCSGRVPWVHGTNLATSNPWACMHGLQENHIAHASRSLRDDRLAPLLW